MERKMHSKFIQNFATMNCRIAIKNSNCNIADNFAIRDDLINDFNIKNCEIIEYGGDHVKKDINFKDFFLKYSFLKKEYYFSLGRSQSDNNQHLILEVFSKLKNYNLVLVSNWNHNEYGIHLKEKYSVFENIYML